MRGKNHILEAAEATEVFFDRISMKEGKGTLIKKKLPTTALCEGISCEGLLSIRISLGKNREIICRWQEEEVWQKEENSEKGPELVAAQQTETAPIQQGVVFQTEVVIQPEVPPRSIAANQNMQENKWKQLWETYPHIAPFFDDREYLSIVPGDFVIFSQKCYRLVGNSFLLHGFYNHGHLILTKVMKKGDEVYYLGVPGNFYDKERQVAVMYGFESFECQEEPAVDGTYGYFMIRVEL